MGSLAPCRVDVTGIDVRLIMPFDTIFVSINAFSYSSQKLVASKSGINDVNAAYSYSKVTANCLTHERHRETRRGYMLVIPHSIDAIESQYQVHSCLSLA